MSVTSRRATRGSLPPDLLAEMFRTHGKVCQSGWTSNYQVHSVPQGPLSIRVQIGLMRYPWGAPNHQALVGFAWGRKSVAKAISLTFLQNKLRDGAGKTRHWVQVHIRKKHILSLGGKKYREEGRMDFEGGWGIFFPQNPTPSPVHSAGVWLPQ